eukprot:jgi/Mesvir1/21755/Mv04160-RA.1
MQAMSNISIPDPVAGKSIARVELEGAELQAFISRFKTVVNRFVELHPQGLRTPSTVGVSVVQPAVETLPNPAPAAPSGPARQLQTEVAPPSAASAPTQPERSRNWWPGPETFAGPAAANLPPVRPTGFREKPPPQKASTPIQWYPSAGTPSSGWTQPDGGSTSSSAVHGTAPTAAAAPAPRPAPAAAAAAAAPPPDVTVRRPLVPSAMVPVEVWHRSCITPASEHNNARVNCIDYATEFSGLPSMGAGWLLSASSRLVNLWGCLSEGQRSTELMVMHSQVTDVEPTHMHMQRAHQLLLLAGMTSASNNGAASGCVCLHSLSGDAFLGLRGRVLLSCPPDVKKVPQAVSLQYFGGPLKEWFVASLGNDLSVYELPHCTQVDGADASRGVTKPRARWRGHDTAITCVQASEASAMSLFSGDIGGNVHVWDLRTQPTAPRLQYAQGSGMVSSIQTVDAYTLLTAGGTDGALHLWDVRKGSGASGRVEQAVLDGKAVVRMALGPGRNHLVVSTLQGLYALSLRPSMSNVMVLDPNVSNKPYLGVAWNTQNQDIYACSFSGSISAFCSPDFRSASATAGVYS